MNKISHFSYSMLRKKKKIIVCILLILIISSVLFSHSVEIRKPWFGTLSEGRHQWLTGSTVKYAKNWYREGPLSLKFSMIDNPSSVEFSSLKERGIYVSYPPGTIMPIYLISKITNNEPSAEMVMSYNLLSHYLIIISLSLIIFLFLSLKLDLDPLLSFFFSIIPILVEVLLPSTLYWHQNVFFADQAVILPFVLFILLEVLRTIKKSRIIDILQVSLAFYGILTDYLFVFLLLVVYLIRIFNKEWLYEKKGILRYSFGFWKIPVFAGILFLIQVQVLFGNLKPLFDIFIFRAAISSAGSGYVTNFPRQFSEHIVGNYGKSGLVLLIFSFLLILVGIAYIIDSVIIKKSKSSLPEKAKDILLLMIIISIPCLMQIYFLKNHSAIHEFSALKFSVPLATIPFVLGPIFLLSLKKDGKFLKNKFMIAILLLGSLSAIWYGISQKEKINTFFPKPNTFIEHVGKEIDQNSDFNSVLFSPLFEVMINPPQFLSYSMKRVYPSYSWANICEKLKETNNKNIQPVIILDDESKQDKFSDIDKLTYEKVSINLSRSELDDMNRYSLKFPENAINIATKNETVNLQFYKIKRVVVNEKCLINN